MQEGRNTTVLAEEGGKLLGYGSLHHGQTRWTRHLGEIRLLVAPGQRGRGVGRLFERLGFHMEALLADWAIDWQGRTEDLVLMSYDVAGFHG